MFVRVLRLPYWMGRQNELVIGLKECSLVSRQQPRQDGTCNGMFLFPCQKSRQNGTCNGMLLVPCQEANQNGTCNGKILVSRQNGTCDETKAEAIVFSLEGPL